jgi:hypothetical protein
MEKLSGSANHGSADPPWPSIREPAYTRGINAAETVEVALSKAAAGQKSSGPMIVYGSR